MQIERLDKSFDIPIGPYGDRDDQQVFVQKVVPFETNQIYVRFCSTGSWNLLTKFDSISF